MEWYLYIVRCSDDSLYTGITKDINARVIKHNAGKGAKALKGKLPVKLVYSETYKNHLLAAQREIEIKSWPRIKKIELIFKVR